MSNLTFISTIRDDEISEALQINEYEPNYDIPPEIKKKRMKDMLYYILAAVILTGVALIIWHLNEEDKILYLLWKGLAIGLFIGEVFVLVYGIRRISERPLLCDSPKDLFATFYRSIHRGVFGYISPKSTDISYFLLAPVAIINPGCSDFKKFESTWNNHIKWVEENIEQEIPRRHGDDRSLSFDYSVQWTRVLKGKKNPRVVDGICQIQVVPKRGESTAYKTTYPAVNIIYKSKAIQYGNNWYMLSGMPS